VDRAAATIVVAGSSIAPAWTGAGDLRYAEGGNPRRGSQLTGTILNIMRFAVHDGPGIRTTVFLKGCPLHCKWCHNPEALSSGTDLVYREERCLHCGDCLAVCPHGAITEVGGAISTDPDRCARCGTCLEVCHAEARELLGRPMAVSDVMTEIERDVPFFDESGGGVTFSGGEPLLQHEFLVELLEACRARRIHTAVDTTGFTSPAILKRVAAVTDLFLYDLKSLDDRQHRELTGVSNEQILANLRALSADGKRVVVRMPVIPGMNDQPANVRDTGEFVAGLPHVPEVQLLPYHRTALDKYRRLGMRCPLPDTTPASPDTLRQIAEQLRGYGLTVGIGG
jgi:pyruvate formate lyase activating enzyme